VNLTYFFILWNVLSFFGMCPVKVLMGYFVFDIFLICDALVRCMYVASSAYEIQSG